MSTKWTIGGYLATPSAETRRIPTQSSFQRMQSETRELQMAQIRHVVFIGEIGAGKSSVINLLANRDCATTSPDATPCTRDFTSHEVLIEGRTYRLWDTPGLNEALGIGMFRRSARVDSLKRFLRERHRLRELDLLVFCFRGGRARQAMSRVYKIFGETTRRIAIPVVIAITHLEGKQPTMDAWWQDNERKLVELGLLFDGHACVTCQPFHHRSWASQREIRDLISTEYRHRAPSVLSTQEYLMDNWGCVVC